jgi:hypothetical protein
MTMRNNDLSNTANALPVKKPPTLWEILLHQMLNPLIFILIAN